MTEIQSVLGRKKFDKYLTREERNTFLSRLARTAVVLVDIEPVSVCRDPKDDKFLELAASGKAAGIVMGDDDLLVLNPFRGIPILTPTQFLELHPVQGSHP
jgi:putative PIN family toxin of toxin-antitoxin system